jgi:hypothetical protein
MVHRRLQAALGAVAASLLLGAFAALPAGAGAATAGPGWTITSMSTPTRFAAGASDDEYFVQVTNTGSEPSSGPVKIAVALPPGYKLSKAAEANSPSAGFAYPTDGAGEPLFVNASQYPEGFGVGAVYTYDNVTFFPCSANVTGTAVTCTDSNQVNPGVGMVLEVGVEVPASAHEGEEVTSTASVTGGGAAPQSTSDRVTISSHDPEYGLESLDFQASGLDGLPDTQAGDRPYETRVSYFLNNQFDPQEPSEEFANAHYGPVRSAQGVREETKDFVVDLPPGVVGNPQVVAKCTPQRVLDEDCPPSTQIGVAEVFIVQALEPERASPSIYPIYNVTPEPGEPADFEFLLYGSPVNLAVNVSQETNYGVRITVAGVPRISEITGVAVTFFGTPLTNHDVHNKSTGAQPLSFLTNPVDCAAGPQSIKVSTDSWERPGSYLPDGAPNLSDPNWKTMSSVVYPSLTDCDMLQFQPTLTVTPDTTEADEPSGVTVDIHVPQGVDEFPALAPPEVENASVTLPQGMSLSPSAADGLQSCSNAVIALESTEPGFCPNASELGTVEIVTPLLEKPLVGHVYLGAPECDPCTSADAAEGKEIRLFIEAYSSGVRIKKEGRVYANPSTGQVTAKFLDNPQDPVEDIRLTFKGGLRAGLATPQECGVATTTSDITPWSSPVTPDATPSSSFTVDSNGAGGACPAVAPLQPSFSAGTSNPNAGQFSPLTLTFGREDREQDLSGIEVKTPPGLLGVLSGVPLCGEPRANAGTCPEASRIGSMTVAAGPGAHPFDEKGSLYLTGPYKGSPFGLSIVVPTVAGPFNLGNVVVRAAITVDPLTAALTVTSEPLPQVIDGIPLRLRSVNVTVDRPGFIFNPTDCRQLAITATISGAQGSTANVSAPFAVAGCAGLHFGPKFEVSTSAHTSRTGGASLDARLIYPPGAQSNVAKVKVELPKALPARLTTLQKACKAATFEANPAQCPAASVIGIVKATTPVLPVPLTGPAYFVSNGGEKFPNLIAVLQGYGVRVTLVGNTFISKKGITSTTFENVPDVQVSSFELYLPEGPNSALTANGNLCTQSLKMPTSFLAQDGARLEQETKITVTGCAKTKKQARKTHKHADAGHGRGKR